MRFIRIGISELHSTVTLRVIFQVGGIPWQNRIDVSLFRPPSSATIRSSARLYRHGLGQEKHSKNRKYLLESQH
jgi:hypothetical protein